MTHRAPAPWGALPVGVHGSRWRLTTDDARASGVRPDRESVDPQDVDSADPPLLTRRRSHMQKPLRLRGGFTGVRRAPRARIRNGGCAALGAVRRFTRASVTRWDRNGFATATTNSSTPRARHPSLAKDRVSMFNSGTGGAPHGRSAWRTGVIEVLSQENALRGVTARTTCCLRAQPDASRSAGDHMVSKREPAWRRTRGPSPTARTVRDTGSRASQSRHRQRPWSPSPFVDSVCQRRTRCEGSVQANTRRCACGFPCFFRERAKCDMA